MPNTIPPLVSNIYMQVGIGKCLRKDYSTEKNKTLLQPDKNLDSVLFSNQQIRSENKPTIQHALPAASLAGIPRTKPGLMHSFRTRRMALAIFAARTHTPHISTHEAGESKEEEKSSGIELHPG